MMITKHISIDVMRKNLLAVVFAVQGDNNSRFLNITFMADGKAIEIENSATVQINATRSGGITESFSGTVDEDGSVTVPLTSWMLAIPDTLICNVSVLSAEDARLTTADFRVVVEKSPYTGMEISEEEEED